MVGVNPAMADGMTKARMSGTVNPAIRGMAKTTKKPAMNAMSMDVADMVVAAAEAATIKS